MIDEKKLIEELKNHPNLFKELGWSIECIDIESVIETINEQPKADWIPCKERLPKLEGEEYLVCKENGFQMLLSWTKKGWNTYKNINGKYHTEHEIKDVIAWQPIQPYKKEGANNS